jgi:hypothetical protein
VLDAQFSYFASKSLWVKGPDRIYVYSYLCFALFSATTTIHQCVYVLLIDGLVFNSTRWQWLKTTS